MKPKYLELFLGFLKKMKKKKNEDSEEEANFSWV